jgi:hypothetical protein
MLSKQGGIKKMAKELTTYRNQPHSSLSLIFCNNMWANGSLKPAKKGGDKWLSLKDIQSKNP